MAGTLLLLWLDVPLAPLLGLRSWAPANRSTSPPPPEAYMISINLVAVLLFIAEVLLALAAAIYVSANRKPSSAIAWVLAVIFIPVIGILFFLLVGAGRLPKHRRDKQHLGHHDHPGEDPGRPGQAERP